MIAWCAHEAAAANALQLARHAEGVARGRLAVALNAAQRGPVRHEPVNPKRHADGWRMEEPAAVVELERVHLRRRRSVGMLRLVAENKRNAHRWENLRECVERAPIAFAPRPFAGGAR